MLIAFVLAPAAVAAGPAANVEVSLSPPIIAADGTSTTTATAMVTDSGTSPVTGDTVVFTSDGGQTISPTTENQPGSYTATITSTTTPGQSTVIATDSSVVPNVSGSATLTQFGPAAHLTLSLSPQTIVADGSSTSTATATVTDSDGNPVVGDTIDFGSDGAQPIQPPVDHGDGTYTAEITSTTRAGASTITATDSSAAPGVSDQKTLTQTPGPATAVSVALSPPSIVADGTSTTLVTATVSDANGNAVAGHAVEISSSTGQSVAATDDQGDGTYVARIHSTTTPGQVTITATDTTAGISGQAQLQQTAGSSTTSLIASPASPATNQVVTLTATVSSNGTGVPISGSITFANFGAPIGGSCSAQPVNSSNPTASCQVSFSAGARPLRTTNP